MSKIDLKKFAEQLRGLENDLISRQQQEDECMKAVEALREASFLYWLSYTTRTSQQESVSKEESR